MQCHYYPIENHMLSNCYLKPGNLSDITGCELIDNYCNANVLQVWLKKIWELSGGSSTYPLKVQEKKKVIYNIRPIIWFSERSKFGAFKSKEEFLNALNETRYQYSKTHHDNSHWLKNVIKNYKAHTGSSLEIN